MEAATLQGTARAADRATERIVRERVREQVGKLLDEERLLSPGPEDELAIRQVIAREIDRCQRDAVNRNLPVIADPEGLLRRVFDSLLRLGILQPLMDSPTVEEIIVNAPNRVYVIESGEKRWVKGLAFDSDEEIVQMVRRQIGPLGKRLDESSPMVDALLRDGSRLNGVIPPVAVGGPSLTIRKFVRRANSLEQLVEMGTLPADVAEFLSKCMEAGVNILVSGPTGSGKTTMLNALIASIRSFEERLLTIEEVPELQVRVPDWVSLQARGSNVEGQGEITIRELVRNALRMRPTRIIVGEVRGKEALDMLLAMNTGHDGSLTTIHGSSPRDALDRLVTLAMMAEEKPPVEALAKMVAQNVDLVLQLAFDYRTRQRRLTHLLEVGRTLEGATIVGTDVWRRDAATGSSGWTGSAPRCAEKMAARGVAYSPRTVADRGHY